MKKKHRATGLLQAALLLISGLSSFAAAEQHFPVSLDSKVGHPVLATMLEASRAGRFYQIEPADSEVWFSIDSIVKPVKGEFTHFKGGITLQPDADNNGQALFVVESDSISTSNIVIDEVVRSKSFFDVEHHPEILFVSSGFSWLSETRGLLKGKLTLRGVTKAVVFNVELSDIEGNKVGNSETILVKINTSISRSMFGMKLMTSVVGDTVRLSMTIQAKKHRRISKEQLVAISSYSGS